MTGFTRAIFWAATVLVLVMALLPQPPQLPGAPSDKVQHILAFATLAAFGFTAYPSTPLLRMLMGLSTFGAIIEVLQTIPGLNRDGDALDWLADSLAAGLVLVAIRWWRSRRETR